MKKLILTTAVCALLSGAALAEQSPWLVRARAVGLDMSNKDSMNLKVQAYEAKLEGQAKTNCRCACVSGVCGSSKCLSTACHFCNSKSKAA